MKITLPSRQIVLFSLVIIAMLFSGATPLVYSITSHKIAKTNARTDAQADCNALYNLLDGNARDERTKFAKKQTTADKRQVVSEIRVWKSLLHQFKDPSSLSDQQRALRFFATIQHQIDSLQTKLDALSKTQTSRIKNPYPDPDSCKDGVITKKEGNVLR